MRRERPWPNGLPPRLELSAILINYTEGFPRSVLGQQGNYEMVSAGDSAVETMSEA